MEDVKANKNSALCWYLYARKRRSLQLTKFKNGSLQETLAFHKVKKKWRREIIQTAIAIFHCQRTRTLWMYPRSQVWFEMVDDVYNDELCYANFRVTKETFAFILGKIEQNIDHKNTHLREAVSAKRRLAVTLYFLAFTAEYRTIGNLFGVSRSFVCQCIQEVCDAIAKQFRNVISFPKGEDLLQVIRGYEEAWGLPMCAGAIDGTHIAIRAPKENHTDYVNRKGFHSILMQAVVDCNYLFRDVVIGWPGSVHDARMFSNSTIFVKGNENRLFPNDLTKEICGEDVPPVILADAAYPLLQWLLKGYPRNEATRCQRLFNYRLSRARMTVENTFGRWKGRYIRFSKRVDIDVTALVQVILASCILHNIIEARKNEFLPNWDQPEVMVEEPALQIEETLEPDAEVIRSALTEYFNS